MLAELPARGIRIGGVTVSPGEARAVAIPLAPGRNASAGGEAGGSAPAGGAGKTRRARQVPAWVIVGAKPGPRVTVVAATRGLEATAARAAAKLAADIEPALLGGSLVVVPVMRPAGRLSRRVGPLSSTWRFPGDAGGKRAERDAFALFSNLVVGAQALLILGGPRRGRRGAVVARGELADPRVRRLAGQTGAVAVLPSTAKPQGLQAAAAEARVPCVELFAEGGPDDADVPAALARAVRASLEALGMLARTEGDAAAVVAPKPVDRAVRVRAPADGFLDAPVTPGTFVRAGARLGRLLSPLPGPPVNVAAPVGGLIIESSQAGGVRTGATLFVLVPMSAAVVRARLSKLGPKQVAPEPADAKTRVGWVEHVALPGLGIERLKAKIDTGARTSALHVARIRTVDTTGGPHRRPILEITVPAGGRGRRPHRVRAAVRGFAVVRDTSGRTERRPVIETALTLGPIKRRIAVTLTNRGDMLFPMLIGRTALGPGIVVDPARRYLMDRGTLRGAHTSRDESRRAKPIGSHANHQ